MIPIVYRDKKPAVRWSEYRGGVPGSRLPTDTELQLWFTRPANLGICTGWDQLHVLDFDNADEYGRWLRWCKKNSTASYVARKAYQVQTRRGVHVYLQVKNSVKHIAVHGRFDVQGNGRFVVGAGSIHPSGAEYTLLHQGGFPLVDNLSDVMPAEALAQTTECQPSGRVFYQAKTTDIWADAWNADKVPTGDMVTAIRQAITVESFFANLERTGDHHYLAPCPLHDDDKPSFWIDTQKQICGCFAGCAGDKPLDVINLYARLHGLNNREAILSLFQRI